MIGANDACKERARPHPLFPFLLRQVVVEEYFVPALNMMCVEYKIPDDVAGATFMAAGASSPEMFAAFISLFITHSALGVGTIIGSEMFNHMVNGPRLM